MEAILNVHKAQDIHFGDILKCVIPAYLTSLFNTLYTIADGIFVSRYVGTNALAAINTVYPIVNVLTGIALVFAVGGSSIAAVHIGAGEKGEADQAFSVSMIFSMTVGCLFAFIIWIKLGAVLSLMGATSVTINDCRIYALIWIAGTPAVLAKELFTYFIRADGGSVYSFFTALSGGVLNIFLDYIFIGQMQMGIWGAGLATVMGLWLSCLIGIYYFLNLRKHLCFTIRGLRFCVGLRCLINGTSEFIDQLSVAVTTVAYNRVVLMLAGEDGIAAVSIIMYLQFIFTGVYFGYSMGISPYLSYAYGRGKPEICQRLEQYSCRFVTAVPILLYGLDFLFAPFCVLLFAEAYSSVYCLAVSGMRLYGLGFLFSGVNIFMGVRLTAYGKGYFSGLFTFLRSLILMLFFLILLPRIWGIAGLWLAFPAAEMAAFAIIVIGNIKYCNREEKR